MPFPRPVAGRGFLLRLGAGWFGIYFGAMTGLALGLILLSAAVHAGWNLLLKRSENKEVFVWWMLFGGAVMLAPLGGWLLYRYPPPPPGWWLALASAVLHVAYFTLLGRGYSRGDLSLVYPIARGIGPMLVPVLAVLTLGERMALPAIAGVGCIVLGIGLVSWWGRLGELLRQPGTLLRDGGIRYAVLTGLTITIYTLVDKRGVGYVQPFLFVYLLTLGAAIGLFPYILRNHSWGEVRREWQAGVWPILAAAGLMFLAYGLVLTAFALSQVSYAAPAREVGIVIGVLLGVFLLKERFGTGRLLGSGFIVLGLGLIALSP